MSRVKTKSKKSEHEIQALYKSVEDSFSQWEFLKEHGGNDPFWADGVNMNLVRNHIIFDYRKLDELEQVPVQMSMFGEVQSMTSRRPIPPKVPNEYMARKEYILATTKKLIQRLSKSDNPDEQRDLERLRCSLEEMNYVGMRCIVRRYENRR